mmetsp:Transcript_141994/g.453948  ORF Transcript_141994/g.453948 Transcript_141994/m.453948 type:complete len:202 (+) Transcript_141994:203-808(+)
MAATISTNSGFKDAPPTRKPSMSGQAESSGAFFAFAEPPYWMRMPAAHSSLTLAAIHLRISACVSCACSAVAVTPVPIAQTGSYAMTTFSGSNMPLTCSNCVMHTAMVASKPFSRSGSFSPMQKTHFMPASRMYFNFVAKSSSLSEKYSRRSEWPIKHHSIFKSFICSTDISPVYAPQPLKLQFCGHTAAPFVTLSTQYVT